MQLTPAFFKLPPPPQAYQPISFPLPTSVDDMSVFLVSEKAIAYRAGITGLIKRLKTWAQSRHPQISFDHDARFLKKFDYLGSDKGVNEINFRLFSEGIEILNNIVQKLESKKGLPINVDAIIQSLISNLDVCAPGVFIHLSKTIMALDTSLEGELLTIRHSIVEAKAQEIVQLNRRELFVGDGNIIHYDYSLINLVVENFGLRHIKDDLSASGTPEFVTMKQDFLAACKNLWDGVKPIVIIINQILNNLDFHNILKHITEPTYSEFFEQQLNKYGPDPSFNIKLLFDDNALAEGIYIPQPHAEQRLIATILNRLVRSGFMSVPNATIEFTNDGTLSHYFHFKNGLLESADEHFYHEFLSGKNIQQTLSSLHPDLFNDITPVHIIKDIISAKRNARTTHVFKQLRADVFYHLSRYVSYSKLQDSKEELIKILLEPSDNPKVLRLMPTSTSEYISETATYLRILSMFSYEERVRILGLAPTHSAWITNSEQAGLYLSLFPDDQWPGLIVLTPSLHCVTTATDLITLLRQLPAGSRINYLSLMPADTLMAMIIAEKEQLTELLNLIPVDHWGQAPLSDEYIRALANIASTPLIRNKNPMMALHFSTQVGGACKTLLLLNSLNPEAAQKFLTYFQFESMHVYWLGVVLQSLDIDKWPFLLAHTRQLLIFKERQQLKITLQGLYVATPDKLRHFIGLLSSENIINLCKTTAAMADLVSSLPWHALPAWIDKVGLAHMQSIVTSFSKYRELISTIQVVSAGPELLKPLLKNVDGWTKLLGYFDQAYIDECLKVLPAEFIDQTFKNIDDLNWVIKSDSITNHTLLLLLAAFSKEHLRKIISTPEYLVRLLKRTIGTYSMLTLSGQLLVLLGGKHLRELSADKNLFYQAMNGLAEIDRQPGVVFYLNIILRDHPEMMINDLLIEYQLDKNFFDVLAGVDALGVFLKDKSVKQCTDFIQTFELSFWEKRITTANDLLSMIKNIWRPSALVLLKKLNPEKLKEWFSGSDSLFTLIELFSEDHDTFYELGPFLMKSLNLFDHFDKIKNLNRGQLMYVMNLGILKNVVTTIEQLVLLIKNHEVQDWTKIISATNYMQLFNSAKHLHAFLSALSNIERGEFFKELYNYDTDFSLSFKKLIFGDPVNFAYLFQLFCDAEPMLIGFNIVGEMYGEPLNIQRTLDALEDDHLRGQMLRFIHEDLGKRGFVMPKRLPPYCRLLAIAHIQNEITVVAKTIAEGGHMHFLYTSALLKRQGLLLQMKGLLELEVSVEQAARVEAAVAHDRVYLLPLFESIRSLIRVGNVEQREKRGLAC